MTLTTIFSKARTYNISNLDIPRTQKILLRGNTKNITPQSILYYKQSHNFFSKDLLYVTCLRMCVIINVTK